MMEFSLSYVPAKAIKGQALADFAADHLSVNLDPTSIVAAKSLNLNIVGLTRWTMYFDDSKTKELAGAGMILLSPKEHKTQLSFKLDFSCMNNQAEYEALIIGLEILLELRASTVEIIGDSELVIS